MRISGGSSLAAALVGVALSLVTVALPVQAQTAADAALDLANMLDGAGGGVSNDAYISALEDAADAGQPMAMWQLGTMYEKGEGVDKDPARAFGYFAQIANQHADAAPRGVESDIVAQSFVKMGDYYRDGVPDAGIPADIERSQAMLLHAASYFRDPDAQYRVGLLYESLGVSPLQSARWFSLAAQKGHCMAQARLGDMLFNGAEGIAPQPVEGLMWLNLSHARCAGTVDQAEADELLTRAASLAQPEIRQQAAALAETIGQQLVLN